MDFSKLNFQGIAAVLLPNKMLKQCQERDDEYQQLMAANAREDYFQQAKLLLNWDNDVAIIFFDKMNDGNMLGNPIYFQTHLVWEVEAYQKAKELIRKMAFMEPVIVPASFITNAIENKK